MAKKSPAQKSLPKKNQENIAELQKEIADLSAELNSLKEKKQSQKKRGSFWRSTFAGFFAVVAVTTFMLFNISFWVKNTVLDTNQFVSTVQPLIKDPDIQKALQTEITNQVIAQINLEAELKKALPENLQFIAAPFAGQVKSFTYGKIGDVLNSDQAYTVWTKTLTTSHAQIISYIQNPNNSGVITLSSVYQLAGNQLKDSDVGFLFGKTLPSSVGSIELANLEGVPKARQVLNALQNVTAALALTSIVSVILAITMSKKRRNMVIGIAISTLFFMVCTLVALQIASTQIAGNVQPQFTAAAEATYRIITAPLTVQTQGVVALISSAILIAIVSSSWNSLIWLKTKMRQGFDYVFRKVVGTWKGANWLNWLDSNRVVIAWTLVAVSFALFALRLPPSTGGVKSALIMSAVAAFGLEITSSLSRVARK
jgi:hypothetical protein